MSLLGNLLEPLIVIVRDSAEFKNKSRESWFIFNLQKDKQISHYEQYTASCNRINRAGETHYS